MRFFGITLPALGLAALFLLPACGLSGLDLWGDPPSASVQKPPADNSPRGLMARGQYGAAWAALQPALMQGDPEAVFYALTIRKNGLDGRAPDPAELRVLWDILILRAPKMREAVNSPDLAASAKNAYLTALAQLAYFAAPASAWPPAPPADPIALERAAELATRYLATVEPDFTPAMNFMAYLYMEPVYNSPNQAFLAAQSAAERGDFLAISNLAFLFRTGIGTAKDHLRAAHRARDCARSVPPIPRCQNEMGHVYEAGLGVTVDIQEALRWYGESAAQGYAAGAANAQRLKSKKEARPLLDDAILF